MKLPKEVCLTPGRSGTPSMASSQRAKRLYLRAISCDVSGSDRLTPGRRFPIAGEV